MARPQKIWWWKARQEWCTKIDKVRHRLGPDKEEAERKFHELMANRTKPVDPTSVVALIDKFLDWTNKNRSEGIYGDGGASAELCEFFGQHIPRRE